MAASGELLDNLSSPPVLCFLLGLVARLAGSDLRLPEALGKTLSIYLLLAIGLKGGVAISGGADGLLAASLGTLLLGCAIPIWSFALARRAGRFDAGSAASLAAHYGSTSAVTAVAAIAYLEGIGDPADGHLPALIAIMEVPAIGVAVWLARRAGACAGQGGGAGRILHEVLLGSSLVLLLGGMAIGAIAGPEGMAPAAPVFQGLFTGAICLFLLDLGGTTADRLCGLRRGWAFLLPFALLAPIVHGVLGVLVGHAVGLSVGGAAALGVIAGSASYIAAPAAMRVACPATDHGPALAASLGLTFPFNLVIGIPLLHWFSQLVA